MNLTKVYGIKNCSTVKKALVWLEQKQIPFEFHDFKKEGIDQQNLEKWANELGWQALVNKRGTTWRKLDSDVQASIIDQKTAIAALIQSSSMIKRPVIVHNTKIFLGFDEESYEEIFH